MINKIKNHFLIISFSIIYLLVGLLTYKDYGIGIEEHFQRNSGLNWLNYIFQLFEINSYNNIIENKLSEIKTFTPSLPGMDIANHYGVLFDLPTAFLEVFFQINNAQNYFYLRHFLNFIIFYISGIFFYNILLDRIPNNIIPFFGFLIYILSPRIYGNSFFDGKDLFFLSIFTITLFFYLRYEKKETFINLLLFSLFCAFATSSRIIGIIIPFSFLLLIILKILCTNEIKNNIKNFSYFLTLYLIFIYFHWPYLWTLNYHEILNFFQPFTVQTNPKVYFNGEFFSSNHLPISYLPIWISITTPIYILILFFFGVSIYLKRFFTRFLNIKKVSFFYDLWRGENEKKDFIIFILLLQVVVIYLSFNLNLFSGWRHFLFLNFFLTYFSTYGLYLIFTHLRNRKKIIYSSIIIFSVFTSELIYKLIIYHPYQSVYFNNLINTESKMLFEIDTQSLSRRDAIKDIINLKKKDSKIILGTASWTPLEDARSMISEDNWSSLIFSGTANKFNADYIYSNHYYEVDTRYNNKYEIPKNFYLYKVHSVDNIIVYSIYKNKNKYN
ncbi:hypothetical protein OAA54_01215 [Pelagibacteraceae bacterium]|nr:hypothetical protein [Pelagibacteraceae bacterium]